VTTPDKPRIRNVLATPAERTDGQWVRQPIALGIEDRICGVCSKQALEPYVAQCPNTWRNAPTAAREDPLGHRITSATASSKRVAQILRWYEYLSTREDQGPKSLSYRNFGTESRRISRHKSRLALTTMPAPALSAGILQLSLMNKPISAGRY
jgi:hypothetical protein